MKTGNIISILCLSTIRTVKLNFLPQQQNSRSNCKVRAAQMASLVHRKLPVGLRGPDERIRRNRSDNPDGQPAHRVPVRAPVDGRTTLVRHVV